MAAGFDSSDPSADPKADRSAVRTAEGKGASVITRGLKQRGWRGFLLDVTLGGLCVLGLAPFHFWLVALLCLAALKLRLDAAIRPKSAFRVGFSFGFGYFLFGMFWIGSAFLARGPEYIPIMPPMILGLALLLSLFWGLAGRLYKFAMAGGSVTGFRSIFLFSAAYFIVEFLRGHVLTGFPWNLPGYIFPAGGGFSQSAAWVGIYGLTLMTFLCAAGLASAAHAVLLRDTRTPKAAFLKPLLLTALTLGGLWGLGTYRLLQSNVTFVESVRIRLVQVPFLQRDQFSPRGAFEITNQFIQTTAAPGLGSVTHVIWPEGAVIGLAVEDESLLNAVGQTLVDVDDTPPVFLFNSLREETRPLASGGVVRDYFNSAVAVTYDAFGTPAVANFSDKSKLVPFGEFVPFGKWAERMGFETLSTALASLTPAKQKGNSVFPGLPPVSAQICYEIIFPGLTPRGQTPAPEWILNQSNDAWYGNSIGPDQHYNQARYRAIEEGLPIVRSASNGFSGTIDPYGRELEGLDPTQRQVLDVALPRPVATYLRAHTVKWTLLLLIMVLFIIYARIWRGGR